MKLFSHIERKGLLFFAPLMAIIIMLAGLYKILDVRLLSEDDVDSMLEHSVVEQPGFKPFNPNVDEYEQLREAGLPTEVAVGIVRWRKYGKVYRMAEDLAMVSGVDDSLYVKIKPYIIIDDSLTLEHYVAERKSASMEQTQANRAVVKYNAAKVRGVADGLEKESSLVATSQNAKAKKPLFGVKLEQFLVDTVSAQYLAGWGLSRKQADVFINYRNASGGIFSEEHLRRCYVVDGAVADSLAKYIVYSESKVSDSVKIQPADSSRNKAKTYRKRALVEINEADSAALVAIDGIGPKSASEIIKYRNYLGGYYSVEQIAELKCVTEENFSKILQQILCDSCKISKIDINFAAPKELERHPYVTAQTLRRIVKKRQLKGGWSRIEEMTEQNILSEEEAKRLAPYLRFRPKAAE